jgi:A/G-specific adenine glycosylase
MIKHDIPKFRSRLIKWYTENQRGLPWRQTDNPYYIWVSEVMLQQTQVDTVIPYYHRFMRQFPDLPSLARADQQQVLKAWEGLGYYARARNLQKAARIITAQHAAVIPDDIESFRKLPGVGDYISAAVLSIAFDRPFAVVDGNVKRVLARLRLVDAPVNKSSSHKIFKTAAEELLDHTQPGTFNQALMELGAMVCTPANPGCSRCPIRDFCRAYATGKVSAFPKRIKTPPTPRYHIAVGVVYKSGQVLITRRKPEGLLGGLWEFPGGKVGPKEDAPSACIREIKEEVNLTIKIEEYLTRVKHAYTHFKIVMDVYRCRFVSGSVKLSGPIDYRWIKLSDIDRYPFPKANHKFIPLLKQ